MSKGQEERLAKEEPISAVDKSTGKAFVVQDVAADPSVCMKFIKEIQHYDKYVKSVKKVGIYEKCRDIMGAETSKATYDVAVFGIKFRYFMIHKFNPRTNTFTWTLDYDRSSDFDDNVGHWQVMKHPSKNGWSRVLYSCQVKLFSWVPGMVVKFLTKTALLEATQWVKKESEAARSKESKLNKSWFSARATVSPCEENRINSEFGRGVCSERDKIHVIFRFGSLASFKGRIYRI
jgi:hypothetical protein